MKNIRLSLLIITCALAFLAVANIHAQTAEQSGLIKTAGGFLVVSNEPGNYYTIEVNGKNVEADRDHPMWFKVNGKFFQVVTARKKDFLKDAGDKTLDDRAVLAAHQQWESDYIGDTLGAKLKVGSQYLKLASGMEAVAWSFDMPLVDARQTAKRQLYLAVVKRDHVLVLNTVVEANDDEKSLQKLLIDTMNTLKPSDKPLPLEKAREQVLKGN
jgi:hypothetical protein